MYVCLSFSSSSENSVICRPLITETYWEDCMDVSCVISASSILTFSSQLFAILVAAI